MNVPLDDLTTVFARLKGLLLTESKAGTAIGALAEAVKKSVVGSLGAGVSLIDPQGRARSTGYTDQIVARADELQYDLGQGPCLTAWAAGSTEQIDDISTETRWPEWCAAVVDLPLRSTLSTALIHDGTAIGALKVHSPLPNAFSEQDRKHLALLAAPAAVLLGNAQPDQTPAQLSRTLREALHSRDSIHTARGILMERWGAGPDEVMRSLVNASVRNGTDLLTLAAGVIDGSADVSR
ncbi:GAF and ANTAR domain-containing protein [Arthrobacter crusticola]|nr:GAF and ANTAR domain-containing protein [Arthrobacter crusticola]